nr:immunoglobulin light chain junction region [Macaca mulatta]MOV34428.1 immunoglobulin light chain junction region [Macaca mulatta]MOV35097.1 immunoglobulin light chain junction region [Macaca mulatta]MOV35371.1 immunoglobulin light chain junction region [Macaca mulatta]MOV35508.1 immunoglobulin light chain junction region [Macaca mulatta]
CMQSREFPFTF